MKVLTLWQPWATLVALGYKIHETRNWATSYRGPLLIHAAKRFGCVTLRDVMTFNGILDRAGEARLPDELPFGAVVAMVNLRDCRATDDFNPPRPFDDLDRAFGDWSPGRYAWRLESIRMLPDPIPLRGRQGLFDAPAELVAKAESAMEAHPHGRQA